MPGRLALVVALLALVLVCSAVTWLAGGPPAPARTTMGTVGPATERRLDASRVRAVVSDLTDHRTALLAGRLPMPSWSAGVLPGSAAAQADGVAVQELRAANWSYLGLHIVVRAAALRRVRAEWADVDVVLDVSGYAVVARDGRTVRRVPSQRGIRRRLTLVWSPHGWLVASADRPGGRQPTAH